MLPPAAISRVALKGAALEGRCIEGVQILLVALALIWAMWSEGSRIADPKYKSLGLNRGHLHQEKPAIRIPGRALQGTQTLGLVAENLGLGSFQNARLWLDPGGSR